MKIILCFGTRTESIKTAPLYHELCQSEFVEDKNSNFEIEVCLIAQKFTAIWNYVAQNKSISVQQI